MPSQSSITLDTPITSLFNYIPRLGQYGARKLASALAAISRHQIIQYNMKRFTRGAHFIAYGRWEWDARRGTFALRLNKPDEIEMLSEPVVGRKDGAPEKSAAGADEIEENESTQDDPALKAIHVGRRVPVYRKLGDFRSKRLREIIHQVLAQLPNNAIAETLPKDLIARQRLN